MNYTVEQFIEDVKKEAIALRQYATPEELHKLNLNTLNPVSLFECIYGQMTGNCKSSRASMLIMNCCRQFIKNSFDEDDIDTITQMAVGKRLDGADNLESFEKARGCRFELEILYLSALEAYIMMPDADVANLLSYLKGETDTLDL